MKCFVAILSNEKCNTQQIKDSMESVADHFQNAKVIQTSMTAMSFRTLGMSKDECDNISGCDFIVIIKPPINYNLLDSYIDPSISKLREFKLGKVFSVDNNLVENGKFVVISKKVLPPYGLPLPLGVTICDGMDD